MESRLHRYDGTDVLVTWDQARCIHAAVCVRSLPAVFDTSRRPWVAPDAADAEAVIATIGACPTGALQAYLPDGTNAESPPARATVRVLAGGPLVVHADVTLQTPDGAVVARDTRVALCRCGRSSHKPYCDGSHRAAEGREAFAHDGRLPPPAPVPAGAPASAPAAPPPETVPTEGPITITLRPDASLFVEGPVAIIGADGETAPKTKVSLCRCGGSSRMPFCDGSHRTNGFRAA